MRMFDVMTPDRFTTFCCRERIAIEVEVLLVSSLTGTQNISLVNAGMRNSKVDIDITLSRQTCAFGHAIGV
jgi:hypothetical protein